MSIYCTLWELRFPLDGVSFSTCRPEDADDCIAVFAQAVPAHIQNDGPKWEFLTPSVPYTGQERNYRSVVITTEDDKKGTKRNGQEYRKPLLTYGGANYAGIVFDDLYAAVMEQLRIRYEKSLRSAKQAAQRNRRKYAGKH